MGERAQTVAWMIVGIPLLELCQRFARLYAQHLEFGAQTMSQLQRQVWRAGLVSRNSERFGFTCMYLSMKCH